MIGITSKTLKAAVETLIEKLPLKDRVYLATLEKKELPLIHFSLGSSVMQEFGLWTKNKELIDSCRVVVGIPKSNRQSRVEGDYRVFFSSHSMQPEHVGNML